MPVISENEHSLNKALVLLGHVMPDDRVFLNKEAALRVLKMEEKNQQITYDDAKKKPCYAGIIDQVENGTIHPDDFKPDATKDPVNGRQQRFDTNRSAKLSSGIAINTTAAVMLAGDRVDTTTNAPTLSEELEIAALLHNVIGRTIPRQGKGALATFLEEDRVTVDENYIRVEFGDTILNHINGIKEAVHALDNGSDFSKVSKEYANAAVAIQALRVREAAKIVSVGLIDRLPEAVKTEFLNDNTLTSDNPADELLIVL